MRHARSPGCPAWRGLCFRPHRLTADRHQPSRTARSNFCAEFQPLGRFMAPRCKGAVNQSAPVYDNCACRRNTARSRSGRPPADARTVWSPCRSAGRDRIDDDDAALIPDHGGALSTDTERGTHRDFFPGAAGVADMTEVMRRRRPVRHVQAAGDQTPELIGQVQRRLVERDERQGRHRA